MGRGARGVPGCPSDGRGAEGGSPAPAVHRAVTSMRLTWSAAAHEAPTTGRRGSMTRPWPQAEPLPGHPVSETELLNEGFSPLRLGVGSLDVVLSCGVGCEWTTVGEVPTGPGLYAFTVETHEELHVAYVGLTEELWMVTKGRLPIGGAAAGATIRPASLRGHDTTAGQHPHRRAAPAWPRGSTLGPTTGFRSTFTGRRSKAPSRGRASIDHPVEPETGRLEPWLT